MGVRKDYGQLVFLGNMRKEYNNAYTDRIGFYGNWEYEVFVVTDDEVQVPHFHVRTDNEEVAVELYTNCFLPHDRKDVTTWFTHEAMLGLAEFMLQPCRIPKFVNNYELTTCMWNTQNYIEYRCETDKVGNIVIPNYSALYNNIDREIFVMQDGGYEGYDKEYIEHLNRIMNKRTWR